MEPIGMLALGTAFIGGGIGVGYVVKKRNLKTKTNHKFKTSTSTLAIKENNQIHSEHKISPLKSWITRRPRTIRRMAPKSFLKIPPRNKSHGLQTQ